MDSHNNRIVVSKCHNLFVVWPNFIQSSSQFKVHTKYKLREVTHILCAFTQSVILYRQPFCGSHTCRHSQEWIQKGWTTGASEKDHPERFKAGFYLGMLFEGKMVKEKCTLCRGLEPQENVSVPLSKHIYSSVFTGRQKFSLYHWEKFGGKAWVFGGEAPPSI